MIIGLSGNAFEEDIHLFLEAGVDLYLLKPIDVNRLKWVLHFYINLQSKFMHNQDIKYKLNSNLEIESYSFDQFEITHRAVEIN